MVFENEEVMNSIIFKERKKIVVTKTNDINDYYKLGIEKAIENNSYIKDSKYLVKVKKCQLLYCVLNVNNDVDIEFENGKVFREDVIKDKELLTQLQLLMEKETRDISEKLNYVLTLNENILSLGFCMDIEFVQSTVLYDKKEITNFSAFLVQQIKKFSGSKVKYDPTFPEFPNKRISLKHLYFYYCKWLYLLEHNTDYDNENIPMSYKVMFEKDETMKSDPLYHFLFTHFVKNDQKLERISLGNQNEFYSFYPESTHPFQ
ncbi:hypothetical protein PIROE2DRAFT_59274 [Piromyces sp. E2]|nr:hypothetical protein PIROE2DRAFT_59274 [Piromyces sp. E2]|eukprot:OUM66621.1 hypothetical protein PIROE2DRAFT_59274 [Piromyces sp. E2]